VRNFLPVAIFSVAVILVYTLFATEYVPEMEPQAPPPRETAMDVSAMTTGELVDFGRTVFEGKGACALCHEPVGGRAPLLDDIMAVSRERLKDPGYTGSAGDAVGYVVESMTDPSAFVVPGYAVPGTDGRESPMPSVESPEIGLTRGEVLAVTAYLQGLSGEEVTVEIDKGGGR